MPELPEVETTVRDLNRLAAGQKIARVWCDAPIIVRGITFKNFATRVTGGRIISVARRGKNILMRVSFEGKKQPETILVHQKMTGHFLYGKWRFSRGLFCPTVFDQRSLTEKVNCYLHLVFFLDSGNQLALSDVRKFSKVTVFLTRDEYKIPDLANLGPEPLSNGFSLAYLRSILRDSRKKIKSFLLDQKKVAGIGNIYADEALWFSRLNPLRTANSLSEAETKRLHESVIKVLKKAILLRGSSFSDYRDASGEPGGYFPKRVVYGREGEKCLRCKGAIKRITIQQRSAHFCPRCQSIK